MLGHQINLTALNAKSDPAPELVAEFDKKFSSESLEALAWAFEAWRDSSPFFPAVSDVRKLIFDYRRGVREQEDLKAKMDERFLLEERRKQGQVPEYGEVIKQLREVAAKVVEPQTHKPAMSAKMLGLMQIAPGLSLTEDEIQARREKERAECERYRWHADNEFNL